MLLELADATRLFAIDPSVVVHALDGVDLTVQAGDFVAITGRSGSGKSTLLNVMGLLEQLTSGTYSIHGQSVETMKPKVLDDLRAEVFGFVFQAFHLVPYMTTIENIELGMTYRHPGHTERRRRAREMIESVGLVGRETAMVSTLSGGERQRVAIARALVRNPEVLLADEPTGNLDVQSARMILDLFSQINQSGVTILVVTHDPMTAHAAKRQVRIIDGRIVEPVATPSVDGDVPPRSIETSSSVG